MTEHRLAQKRASNKRCYPKHREKLIAKTKAWQAANRERHAGKGVEWLQALRDRLNARQRVLRAAKIEHSRARERAQYRKDYAKNPARFVEKWHIRRARKQAVRYERIYRAKVYERDKGICQLCLDPVEQNAMSLDHRVPLARGGPHTYDNVQLAHLLCNVKKGARA